MNRIQKKYFLLFLGIISINYFFFLYFFGSFTSFYHDNFDSIVVYNKIIGKIYREGFNFNLVDIFLSGEIEFYYLRHIFKPFIIFYSIFNTELAYRITEVLFKIVCYLSFYKLAIKISKNYFISFLSSTLFSSFIIFTTLGFGLAILPYIIYLLIYKNKLKIKHYILIVLFGLNTDFIADFLFVPISLISIFLINKDVLFEKFAHILTILIIFFFCSMITSLNIFYVQFFGEIMHRIEFNRPAIPFLDNLTFNLIEMFKIPIGLNYTFFKKLPYAIILIPLIFISFFSKDKRIKKILTFIISIHILSFFLNTESVVAMRDSGNIFFKNFKLFWLTYYFPFIHAILFLYLIEKVGNNIYKFLINLSVVSILCFQLSFSAVPFVKKFIFQEKDYRNFYTFSGYYLFNDYKKIKEIVQDNRVMSINLDPMVAVMNDINVIDGYHALYPLAYKKKFREIIKDELENNESLRNYYDNWGSRVYVFSSNPENVLVDFKQAKKIGAKYVISKNSIKNTYLEIVCENCSNFYKLYKIK